MNFFSLQLVIMSGTDESSGSDEVFSKKMCYSDAPVIPSRFSSRQSEKAQVSDVI